MNDRMRFWAVWIGGELGEFSCAFLNENEARAFCEQQNANNPIKPFETHLWEFMDSEAPDYRAENQKLRPLVTEFEAIIRGELGQDWGDRYGHAYERWCEIRKPWAGVGPIEILDEDSRGGEASEGKEVTSVTIEMKDGTKREFPHQNRPGGRYTNKVRYEGAFVIITDSYYNETAIPVANVKEVKVSNRGW